MAYGPPEGELPRRAEALMREGRFDEAAALAGRGLASGARSSALLRVYAEALWAEGRLPAALRAAAVAARLTPADPRAGLTLAQLLLASGRAAAARAAAKKLAGAWADNAAAILAGDVKRFNISAEVSALVELFKTKFAAADYEASFRLAENLLNLRAPRGNEIVSALAAPVTSQSVLYPASVVAGRMGKLYAVPLPAGLEVWRSYYLTYLASAPVLAPTAGWERLRQRALGEWRRVNPDDTRRYGWMFKEIGRKRLFSTPPDHLGARRAFAAALSSPPPEGDAFGRMAEAELCLGRERAAFGWLKKALAACPDQEGPLLAWRGELKLFIGDYPGALADLSAAALKKAYYAHTWLAMALMKNGKTAAALKAADRAVRVNRKDGEALVVRGEIRRLKNDQAGAREDLLKALKGAFPYRHGLWAGLNLLLLDPGTGGAAALRHDMERLSLACRGAGPAEDLCRVLSPLSGRPAVMKTAVEAVFSAARGCRRDEPYLFPLWLTPRGRRAGILGIIKTRFSRR